MGWAAFIAAIKCVGIGGWGVCVYVVQMTVDVCEGMVVIAWVRRGGAALMDGVYLCGGVGC